MQAWGRCRVRRSGFRRLRVEWLLAFWADSASDTVDSNNKHLENVLARIEVMQAQCNTCGGMRKQRILKKVSKSWDDERYSVWGKNEYSLLECAGCEDISLLDQSWFSENTDSDGNPVLNETYYPPSIYRRQPTWFGMLDKQWHITKLLQEVYNALQNSAPALAAMGLRAIIEAIMIDKVKDGGTFSDNLKKFRSGGYISDIQHRALLAALELGHASIHRGHIPDDFELDTALDITENLVHLLYVLEHRAQISIRGLPKRNP